MAKKAAAEPDTIVVTLANQRRTSAGDFTTPVVELPGDEARALIASGLATRVEVLS